MSVIYGPQPGGGGFNPLGLLSTLAMMVPGAQVAAPWLQLANAGVNAAKGNWSGAAMSGVGALTGGANGKSIFGSSATKAMPPIEPTMGMDDVSKYLSDNNPMANADETKYQGLLGQYGLGGKQAVGENADMGTRYVDNLPQRNYDYDSLLNQYGLTDMDWTGRRKRRWI